MMISQHYLVLLTKMYPHSKDFIIKRNPTETDQNYAYRCWFINKINPVTFTDYLEAVKWSIIAVNIEFHKCIYNEHVMNMHDRIKNITN